MIEDNEEIQTFAAEDPPEEPVVEKAAKPEKQKPVKPAPKKVKTAKGKFTPYLAGIIAIILIVAIGYAFVKIQGGQETSNLARTRHAQGRAALVDGDLSRALYEFTVALELDPGLPGAHSALGGIAIANGNGNDAVIHFQAELEINPQDRQSRLALGCIFSLGLVPADDPMNIRLYLLEKFNEIIPFDWPDDFEYVAPTDIDPLTQAIYQFEYVLEHLPADPAPEIGLALSELARNDLNGARNRLSSLIMEVEDDQSIRLVQGIIEDINHEEQYQLLADRTPATLTGETPPTTEPFEPVSPSTDLTGDIGPLPSIAGLGEEFAGNATEGGFGSRDFNPLPANELPDGQNGLGLRITRDDLEVQPTVKPVSNDIYLEEAREFVSTVRLANINQAGSVGFRVGETVVMPNTNVEVAVVEAGDDRIVLQEGENTFVWVKGEIGWDREIPEPVAEDTSMVPVPEGVTVHSTGEENEEEAGENNDNTTEELGPDVTE